MNNHLQKLLMMVVKIYPWLNILFCFKLVTISHITIFKNDLRQTKFKTRITLGHNIYTMKIYLWQVRDHKSCMSREVGLKNNLELEPNKFSFYLWCDHP